MAILEELNRRGVIRATAMYVAAAAMAAVLAVRQIFKGSVQCDRSTKTTREANGTARISICITWDHCHRLYPLFHETMRQTEDTLC